MNKKQLVVTSFLIFLMLILAITQGFFTKSFEKISLVDSSTNQNTEYEFNDDSYAVSFPNNWSISEENISEGYISYKLNFKEQNNSINGLLEVINTNQDVGAFADNDVKKQSLKYYDCEVIPFKNKNNVGVLLKYNTNINGGYDFKNQCYYINTDDGKIIKVLFNIKENDYNESLDAVCSTIISSIKQNK